MLPYVHRNLISAIHVRWLIHWYDALKIWKKCQMTLDLTLLSTPSVRHWRPHSSTKPTNPPYRLSLSFIVSVITNRITYPTMDIVARCCWCCAKESVFIVCRLSNMKIQLDWIEHRWLVYLPTHIYHHYTYEFTLLHPCDQFPCGKTKCTKTYTGALWY